MTQSTSCGNPCLQGCWCKIPRNAGSAPYGGAPGSRRVPALLRERLDDLEVDGDLDGRGVGGAWECEPRSERMPSPLRDEPGSCGGMVAVTEKRALGRPRSAPSHAISCSRSSTDIGVKTLVPLWAPARAASCTHTTRVVRTMTACRGPHVMNPNMRHRRIHIAPPSRTFRRSAATHGPPRLGSSPPPLPPPLPFLLSAACKRKREHHWWCDGRPHEMNPNMRHLRHHIALPLPYPLASSRVTAGRT